MYLQWMPQWDLFNLVIHLKLVKEWDIFGNLSLSAACYGLHICLFFEEYKSIDTNSITYTTCQQL